MDLDLASLEQEDALTVVVQLLDQLATARDEVERMERRAAGIRKVIDGLVEMFPAAEDLLPEDLDPEEDPRPRGAEAVRRVLSSHPGTWHTVSSIVNMLDQLDWTPKSSNPSNAVRTALERLHDSAAIEKGRSDRGQVTYRLPKAETTYDYEGEPF